MNAEYYYNRPGDEARRKPFAGLLEQAVNAGIPPEQAMAAASSFGAYEPNSYSRQYAAFFAVWNRFLRSYLTLSCNAVANLDQSSALLAAVLAYRDLNDFGLSFTVYGFAGPKGTEYTLAGDTGTGQLLAQVAF